MGNMGKDMGIVGMDGLPQNGSGANAVYIVITINGNRMIGSDMGADEVGCGRYRV